MNAQDSIVPFTALLMFGLIWIRTRIQYARPGTGPLRLQPAGRIYFAAAAALFVLGWFAAPGLGQLFRQATTGVTPTLMRVVWCLATYYVFIVIHRIMKNRGTEVFSPRESSRADGPR